MAAIEGRRQGDPGLATYVPVPGLSCLICKTGLVTPDLILRRHYMVLGSSTCFNVEVAGILL